MYEFEVEVKGLEPMSFRGKGGKKYAKKKEVVDAIRLMKGAEVQKAQEESRGKRVCPSESISSSADQEMESLTPPTRKDIDNLLKLVFDALQSSVDAEGKMEGLGIIRSENVCLPLLSVRPGASMASLHL